MKQYLAFLIPYVIFLMSTYYHKLPSTSPVPKGLNISRDTITPLEDSTTFVISAYYDGRVSSRVRVLTIIHGRKMKELYCWFYCTNYHEHVSVKATIEFHIQWFGFDYGPADVVCPEPQDCFSHHISIHWSNTNRTSHVPKFQIKNRDPQPFSANFTVCVSTMFGNQENVLQFVQAIEMYRLLGAQKVVVYKTGCSKAIGQVLDYYVSKGVLEIIPWPIDKYLRTSDVWHQNMNKEIQIGYYGQLLALNDCVYRNMYRSRYVTLNDMDEIILPRIHKTWDEMMVDLEKKYPNTAVYLIKNYYYPSNITDPHFQRAFPNNVPGTNILQLIHYEKEKPNVFNGKKMMVNPREVVQVSVHSALRAYKETVFVPDDIVSLHHGRTSLQKNATQVSLIRDTTIWKYNSSLVTNVNEVLRQLNYH
ncbi:glycosyltransferase family 92 protein F13G3.3-like [Anomaloglossus baeobatrachus]|uniref:glycosyltransferase family 92 protein F13G3.3-like n=1 Tax=Anomaloglossus baeobatrachus TaxID=238106 RepID=UPI003F503794